MPVGAQLQPGQVSQSSLLTPVPNGQRQPKPDLTVEPGNARRSAASVITFTGGLAACDPACQESYPELMQSMMPFVDARHDRCNTMNTPQNARVRA